MSVTLTERHDVVVDPLGSGKVWYSNFGEQTLGELDPVTGKVTEYPLPLLKPDAPTGSLDLEFDPSGKFAIAAGSPIDEEAGGRGERFASQTPEEAAELAEYNRYLEELNAADSDPALP